MADVIKKIKIKKEDGTYTDYIPIGAEAKYIYLEDGRTLSQAIKKNLYVFNTIQDAKECSYLKVGDRIKTLGYYVIDDCGGAEYIVKRHSTEIINNINIIKLQNNLIAILIFEKNIINLKSLGAYGDDSHDDSDVLEFAINYAIKNNMKLNISSGTYKITRSLYFRFYRYTNVQQKNIWPDKSPEIIGIGTVYSTKDITGSVIIKGYNITDKNSILNFIGRGVNSATAVKIENITFQLDYETCTELSFCLTIGDANFVEINKCLFKGFNCVIHRCGSGMPETYDEVEIQANGYLFANVKYSQCHFDCNLYVNWDYTTVNMKNRFGFAIIDERFLVKREVEYKHAEDSVTFENCLFRGSVYSYICNALYLNCMWEQAIAYKPEIDITNDSRFNQDFLVSKKVDCSKGLVITTGKVVLQNPYFEDVLKQISVERISSNYVSTVTSVLINGGTFNNTLNHKPTIDGHQITKADYAINIEGTNYNVYTVEINGASFSQEDYNLFKLKNTIARNIIIKNCSGIDYNSIIDTGSYHLNVDFPTKSYQKYRQLTFEKTLESGNGEMLICNDLKNILLNDKLYHIASATIITEGTLGESENINLQVLNNNIAVPSTGHNNYQLKIGYNQENKYNYDYVDNNRHVYIYKSIPGNDDGANYERKWAIPVNNYLGVRIYCNNTSSSSLIGKKVKIILDLES